MKKWNKADYLIAFISLIIIAVIFLTQDVKSYPITLWSIFAGLCAVAGFFMMGKIFWMIFYEWKYGEGAGEAYIQGELKEYLEDLDNEYEKEKYEYLIKED